MSFILGKKKKSSEIITRSAIVIGFSVLTVYVSYMQDSCKYHESVILFLVFTAVLQEDRSVFAVSFLLSIVCEHRMTAPCQSIVKIISQSNSEIGCSLIKQWDYMSVREREGWEEAD